MFTTTTTNQPRPGGRYRLIALVLGLCALAIPASASAFYGSASDNGSGPAPENVARNSGLVIPDHTALNESLAPVTRSHGDPPPVISASSADPADPFDWADAALGAGITMALVAIGGAALLTLRRRTTVSRPASAS
jgi:hypothetical protein